jgi:hypothetical protein
MHGGLHDSAAEPQRLGASIKIINNGSSALSGWSLTWSFANGQTIASSWNGTASQSGASVTASEQAGQSWETSCRRKLCRLRLQRHLERHHQRNIDGLLAQRNHLHGQLAG